MVADSFYGNDFSFREALRQRGLAYAVQVEPTTVVWTEDPNRPWPPPQQKGRPRKYPPLQALPQPQDLRALAERLPRSAWRTVAWRQGSRGMPRSRFALLPVGAAHGWRQQEHPLRVVESLLVAWPTESTEPTKYWLVQLGSQPPDCGAWCASPRLAGEWSWITASCRKNGDWIIPRAVNGSAGSITSAG